MFRSLAFLPTGQIKQAFQIAAHPDPNITGYMLSTGIHKPRAGDLGLKHQKWQWAIADYSNTSVMQRRGELITAAGVGNAKSRQRGRGARPAVEI